MWPFMTPLKLPKRLEENKPEWSWTTYRLMTPRGHPLVCGADIPEGVRIVTVEQYEKWYSIFVVQRIHDDCTIEEHPFPSDMKYCKGESPFVDHVPNPRVIMRWAAEQKMEIDPLSLELMIGRWHLEATEDYPPEET